MNPLYSEFKRKFSLSMYKNLKIKLGEMSFFKDYVNDTRGNPYPVITKSEDCVESVANNLYTVSRGEVKRMFCQFFPFASYEVECVSNGGEVGFCFRLGGAEAQIVVKGDRVCYCCQGRSDTVETSLSKESAFSMIVSCRPGAFDVYFRMNGKPEYTCTFYEELFSNSNRFDLFSDGYADLFLAHGATVCSVSSYVDNGISIADIRPIKYENGDVITENGKIYFTASVRMQESSFHGVFSWIPSTAEFQMTGAVFYDTGDGVWRNYLAPVIVYDRIKGQWYVWVSSFEHEHVLAYGCFDFDVRFGVNVVDVDIMDKAATTDITAFAGFVGDEDPDVIYDEKNDRWLMAICRLDPSTGQYVYVFFESKEPLANYKYVGQGYSGAETGGSFVRADGGMFFICGNDFSATSEYRIYGREGMKVATFNYPDGGFRGWGTVIPVKMGSRTRYFWLTFDRHNGSSYNWSYGNLYCFEADMGRG